MKLKIEYFDMVATCSGNVWCRVKIVLNKELISSEFFLDDNLYLPSVGTTCSRLYSNLKGEYFVVECLITRWAKKIFSIVDDQCIWLSSNKLSINFLIVCLDFRLKTCCSTPVRRWSSSDTSLTNSLP